MTTANDIWQRRKPRDLAAALFAIYYIAACLTGARFTTDYLDYGWQLVPRSVLVSDPIGSAVNLHIQPPGWNLFLGLLLRASPFGDGITLQLVFAVFGVIAVWLLTDLAQAVGIGPVASIVAVLYGSLHPDVLSNLFEPRYELVVELILIFLTWTIVRRGLSRASTIRAAVAAAGAATMVRAMFHPLWLVIVLMMLICWAPSHRRRAAVLVSLASLVVPVAVMTKNLMLVDSFTLSSWSGMNLLRSVSPMYATDELNGLVADGRVAPIAALEPFAPLEDYRALMPACVPESSHPALSDEVRPSTIAVSNFNNECYAPIYREAGAAARSLISERPWLWLRGRWEATEWWATRGVDLTPSRSPLVGLTGRFYLAADVQVPVSIPVRHFVFGQSVAGRENLAIVVGLATLLAALAPAILRRRRHQIGLTTWRTTVFVSFLVVWTYVVGVVGELGEQARFRSQVQRLCIVVAVALVGHLAGRSRLQRAEATIDDSSVHGDVGSALGRGVGGGSPSHPPDDSESSA